MSGWPYRSLRVTGAMVVFTSGIVDGHECQLLVGWGLVVTCCLTLVGDGVKHTVGS